MLYEIDDNKHAVIVLDIRPRSGAYRPHSDTPGATRESILADLAADRR